MRVTAQSEPLVALAAARGVRAVRLPLGVGLDAWPVTPPRRRDEAQPFRLIHLATVNAVKDPDTLLETVALLRGRDACFTLDVIGEDLTGGRVEARAASLGLGDVVRFHGQLPQPAVRAQLLGADVLIMTSLHEGGPMVLAEAALSGVPTVGTHVGQIAEWAPGAAITAPPGDAAALAASIRSLMENEALRLRIAAVAQQRARVEDADWSAARIDDLYRELAS